ncbi:hypothetical protein JGE79_22860, partial [Salmonella enterica subsp. enterica serovar Kentucky]|nr:hypothetical protein [Salmonella enterica subsp. enterica serovar Kentucky]
SKYIEVADSEGLTITQATETHIHADFASGIRDVAKRLNANIYVSKKNNGAWNFCPQNAGYWEHIPKSITKLSDLKIVGLDFYITTEESKRFTDFPKDFKGIAGWILEVKSNTPGNTTQVLRRNNFPSAHQFLVRNFGTGGVGKWSLFEGKVVE